MVYWTAIVNEVTLKNILCFTSLQVLSYLSWEWKQWNSRQMSSLACVVHRSVLLACTQQPTDSSNNSSTGRWGKAETHDLNTQCKWTVKWTRFLALWFEYTCQRLHFRTFGILWATAIGPVHDYELTQRTNSSQFTCTVTGLNEGKNMKEDESIEDSKKETRRAACNLLHPKFSGDAPPRRVVAANPPSREVCVRGAEWAWGGKQQISKGAQGLSLLEPFTSMCLAFLGLTTFATLDVLSLVHLLNVMTFMFWISNETVWVTNENIFATLGCIYWLALQKSGAATRSS
jgi:hypothetical protein